MQISLHYYWLFPSLLLCSWQQLFIIIYFISDVKRRKKNSEELVEETAKLAAKGNESDSDLWINGSNEESGISESEDEDLSSNKKTGSNNQQPKKIVKSGNL